MRGLINLREAAGWPWADGRVTCSNAERPYQALADRRPIQLYRG